MLYSGSSPPDSFGCFWAFLVFLLGESLEDLDLFLGWASPSPLPPPFCLLLAFISVPPSSAHSSTQAFWVVLHPRTQSNNSLLFLEIGNLQSLEHWKFLESHLFKQMSPFVEGFLFGADVTIQRRDTKRVAGVMNCMVNRVYLQHKRQSIWVGTHW